MNCPRCSNPLDRRDVRRWKLMKPMFGAATCPACGVATTVFLASDRTLHATAEAAMDQKRRPSWDQADEFRRLVSRRFGCAPRQLQCPRETSEMTPCIARDGRLAVADARGGDVCVGCERRVFALLEREQEAHPDGL